MVEIQITRLKQEDIPLLFEMIEMEPIDWNIQLEELFDNYRCYPKSFFGAFNQNGQLLGHVYTRALNENTAVLESVIVQKDVRKQGICTRLISHIMDKFKNYNIVVNPFRGLEAFYTRFGFKETKHGAYMLYHGTPNVLSPSLKEKYLVKVLNASKGEKNTMKSILQYVEKIHKLDIGDIIERLVCSPNATTFFIEEENIIKGFIILKKLPECCRVSLFYADDVEASKCLFNACLKETEPGMQYKLMYPTSNAGNCMAVYEEFWGKNYSKGCEQDFSNYMSTSGDIEDVEWGKIYCALCASVVMFI